MFQDYKDLLTAFQSHGVKYLVIGGYAVIYHAQPRFTKDLDVFVKPDIENATAIYAALASFGAPLAGISPDDFTREDSFFRFGVEPYGFDILMAIPGVDFDTAWANRVEDFIDPGRALKVNFISAENLISAKTAAGRPQDLADVQALRDAAQSRLPSDPAKPPQA